MAQNPSKSTPNPVQGTPRPHIANLLRIPRFFIMLAPTTFEGRDDRMHICKNCEHEAAAHLGNKCPTTFVLVNESNKDVVKDMKIPNADKAMVADRDYTRDDLVMMIGQAYPEFADIVREIDQLKKDYIAACDVVRKMHIAAIGGQEGLNSVDPILDIGNLRSRFLKGVDVLKAIAYGNKTAEQAKFVAEQYLEGCKRVGALPEQPENVLSLVNETPKDHLTPMLNLLQEFVDNVSVPDRNCSCHISPPCNDCVDNGHLRHLLEEAQTKLDEYKVAPPAQGN